MPSIDPIDHSSTDREIDTIDKRFLVDDNDVILISPDVDRTFWRNTELALDEISDQSRKDDSGLETSRPPIRQISLRDTFDNQSRRSNPSRRDDGDQSHCSIPSRMSGMSDDVPLDSPSKRSIQTQCDIHAECGDQDAISKCSASSQRSIPSDSGGGGSICSTKSKRSVLI